MWNGLKRVSGGKNAMEIEYLSSGDLFVSEEREIAHLLADKFLGLSQEDQSSETLLRAEEAFLIWKSP